MPISPGPLMYTCPSCGWSKTVAPKSDALMPGDHYAACPKCQHSPLNNGPANAAQAALGQLSQQIKRFLR